MGPRGTGLSHGGVSRTASEARGEAADGCQLIQLQICELQPPRVPVILAAMTSRSMGVFYLATHS